MIVLGYLTLLFLISSVALWFAFKAMTVRIQGSIADSEEMHRRRWKHERNARRQAEKTIRSDIEQLFANVKILATASVGDKDKNWGSVSSTMPILRQIEARYLAQTQPPQKEYKAGIPPMGGGIPKSTQVPK